MVTKSLFIILLLLITGGRINASSPNTGQVPEFCVKLEFSALMVERVEPSSWELMSSSEEVVITNEKLLIRLTDFVLKDNEEIIGFSWEVKNASVDDFTVKHGTTVLSYGNEFLTTDRKGVSNAVWCLTEIIEEEPEDEEPEEEPEVEEPPVDEEPEEPPVEEEPEEEPEEEEPPVDDPEDEDPEFEDDEEPLPQTSDTDMYFYNILFLLLGLVLFSRKEN